MTSFGGTLINEKTRSTMDNQAAYGGHNLMKQEENSDNINLLDTEISGENAEKLLKKFEAN